MGGQSVGTMIKSASAIVLAGGCSSRMGRSKAMLRFGDRTLLERTVAELATAFGDIVVVAAPKPDANLPPLGSAHIVHDEKAYQGPVAALAKGLRAARHGIAFTCSCDLPMLNANVASWLLCLIGECDDAVIPSIGERLQPLHAVYRRRCADILDAMIMRGEHRLTEIAGAASVRIVSETEYRRTDPDALSCFNINTPRDYARALQQIANRPPPR